jgi:tetratricopeptide (TPR) repeat protein
MPDAIKVFISYSHDSPEHMDRVLALSDRLRKQGVDCRIDQYEQSPEEGWPLWCEKQVERSQFVLVACTETYLRRFKGEEEAGKGLGGTWEGHIITQELYNAQGKNNKFIPILFCQEDAAHTPLILQGVAHYELGGTRGYELLYRRLTRQPLVAMPPLGSVVTMPAQPASQELPSLPQLERKQEFLRWNVPYARNPFFTGRERILEALRAALEKRGRAALSGLGGVGKTQTAAEYAYRHRKEYESVFWARAESRETLLSSFVSIATLLNLPESAAKEQQAAIGAVRRWLEANSGWLLVLDNADDVALAREFIPDDAQGHILLTTRAQATSVVADRVEIEEMEQEEGALFLLRRAGIMAKDQPLTAASAADRKLAEQISKELGGLPLALDQGGAFIEETPSSLAEYLEFYRWEGGKLRAERGGLGDHPSVTITLSLAFSKVAGASAAAADLIRLCAFLAADAIPEEIFTEGAAELGENLATVATSPFAFAQVLQKAGLFSLIDRNPHNKTLDVHRLVQAVVKDGMEKAEERRWAERAVRAVNRAFPGVEFSAWPKCERLLPHAQACAAPAEEFGFEFDEVARLFNQAGFYLSERARYAEAEPLFRQALAVWEKALGKEHPNVATSLNNLAELYRAQGKYAEAEPLYQRSLAIDEKALGPEHPGVALDLNNVAGLYSAEGKYVDAEPLYQRSLAIDEKAFGPEHPGTATGLNNLAELYRLQGRYPEAEPLYRRALMIREKVLGPEHPAVATGLNNLAVLYKTEGKYAQAESLHERALAIREKALGPDHPSVATSLNNLAELYRAQEKYAEAEPLYRRALVMLEKALGPEHPSVAASLNNLAVLYDSQGKYAEAEPLYHRALAIDEKALGPEHPDFATDLENYAALLRQTGRPSQAAQMEARAKAIRAKQT